MRQCDLTLDFMHWF